ncbi:MAG: FecR domain-containing protein [Pseudomonadota bacterium]
MFQKFVLLAFLASGCGSATAASSACVYLKPATEIDDARTGGAGMGGTGTVSKGTGIGGTGVSPETEPDAIRLAGNVTYSQGLAEAKSYGRSRLLAQGDPVCVGETIVTSQTGKLQIKMTDDGLVALRPGTQMKIEKYVYSGTSEDISVFALLNGATRFVTGNIGKSNPQNDLIRTQTATIGVRGTDHEAMVILPGDSKYPSGTYDKVNTGVTFIRTERGEIDIHPNQVGLAAAIGEMPTLLKDIPDFYSFGSSMQEQGNPPEAGHKEEGSAENIREGSTPEQSGKEIEFDHPTEVGTSSGEHSGNRIDMDHTESHSRPELPESHALPELPESLEIPELPESPGIPELPELPED